MIGQKTRLASIDKDIMTALGGRELYGLEILDNLNQLEQGLKLGFGRLYPALARLERQGFIEWRWADEPDDTGDARRKYYKMTELGSGRLN
jgi:PadR family transcriptional regulator, regulatory protein PadR